MSSARLLIIGVGSPAGDDRLGWEVIARLKAKLPDEANCDLWALDRPGAGLIEYLDRAEVCWLVDALLSKDTPGRYLQPGLELLMQSDDRASGSHGFGLADTLRLAERLGMLPQRIELHCLTINSADTLSEQLSPAVDAGVNGLVERLYQRLIDGMDHADANSQG
ncbi:hydrogenase [Marinobacterium zhoushanense]|uniref:Hydrogenase n=1 Tax=Marinobacterium zhoushanense TaxID=1679163 RepID=A0ABQ1JYT8_9GAMM|nr:hydrogenase maturation protease [Marinobacterium zhoushanense]GGB81094.1 hydrogenase [Marinobacterium zhoushanense]